MRAHDQIRIARHTGTLRRHRRLARQRQPKATTRQYTNDLLALVRLVDVALEPLLDELPSLVRSSLADRARTDVGEQRRIRQLLEVARTTVAGAVSDARVEALLSGVAERAAAFNAEQLSKQVAARIGVSPLLNDTGLPRVLDGFVNENVSLIKSLPTRSFDEIETLTTRAFASGANHQTLAKEIEDKLRITRNRARLIARDQISKLNGQVNAFRQQRLGVTRFIWRTSGDERVRDSHDALNGRTFKYTDLPSEGLPGEPIGCRCHPEPVLEDLL